MPPAYVKPYAKRGKTDAADAEAICEAVTRLTMRFVAVKTPEQQAVLMLPQDLRSAGAAENWAYQCAASPLGRVWHHQQQWAGRCHRLGQSPSRSTRSVASTCAFGVPHDCGIASGHRQARSIGLKRRSSPGIVPAMPAADWRPSRASGRSLPRRLLPRCRMPRCSDPDGSLRLGLVLRRGRKAPAARNGSGALASKATAIYADYSSWVPQQ